MSERDRILDKQRRWLIQKEFADDQIACDLDNLVSTVGDMEARTCVEHATKCYEEALRDKDVTGAMLHLATVHGLGLAFTRLGRARLVEEELGDSNFE